MKKIFFIFLFTLVIDAVTVFSQAPGSPVLVLPPKDSKFVPTTVTLQWQNVQGATSYYVQIGTDANAILTGIVADSSNAFTNHYTFPAGVLQGNTFYYWRVTARNSFGMGTPSDLWDFRTVGTPSQETINLITDVTAIVNNGQLAPTQGAILNSNLQTANTHINQNHFVLALIDFALAEFRILVLHNSGMLSASNAQGLDGTADYIIAVIRGGNDKGQNNYVQEKTFSLKQNYPNPFNPSTTIEYSIPNNSFVTVKVYDIQGKEVASLINKEQNAGSYITAWDATNVSSGVYFYKLTAQGSNGSFTQTKKMLLSK